MNGPITYDKITIYLMSDYVYLYKVSDLKKNQYVTDKNAIICIFPSWHKSIKVNMIYDNGLSSNLIILANTEEEKNYFQQFVTCDVLYCNRNAFINENDFTVINDDKLQNFKYNMVINSCFEKYKNTIVARSVSNVVYIGYFNGANNCDLVPRFGYVANFTGRTRNKKDHKPLQSKQINAYYNQSLVGGIFSSEEGACLASTEYLLAGLPVISTQSTGGRDIWYNDNNSIICKNDPDDVARCMELAKNKLVSGEFNQNQIRNECLKLMDYFRTKLATHLSKRIIDMGYLGEINMDLLKSQISHVIKKI